MDKLKPLLEHKFWFLYAFALILPPVGWWMSSGEMATTIDQRTASINSSFATAKKTAGEQGIPNNRWTEAVKNINTQQQEHLTHTTYHLWEVQRNLMTWPQEVRQYMEGLPFRGEPEDRDSRLLARYLFADTGYRAEIEELRELLDPFDPREQTGKIVIADGALPLQPGKYTTAGGQEGPLYPEMWDTMEDIWLLRDLFEAIDRVNRDSNALAEASIKVLRKLSLHGGAPAEETVALSQFGTPLPTKIRFRKGKGAGFPPTEVFGTPPEPGESADGQRPRYRYVDFNPDTPYVTRGFYLEVIMDHRQAPELFAQLTKSSWPVEIKRMQMSELTEQDRRNPAGTQGDEEDSSAGEEAIVTALEDPYLAVVSVAGLMMLFKPVDPPANLPEQAPVDDEAETDTPPDDAQTEQPVTDTPLDETGVAEPVDAESEESDPADPTGEPIDPEAAALEGAVPTAEPQ